MRLTNAIFLNGNVFTFDLFLFSIICTYNVYIIYTYTCTCTYTYIHIHIHMHIHIFISISVFPACISMHHVHAQCLQRPLGGVKSHGTKDDSKLPRACWELNLSSLEKQTMLLVAKTSLQSIFCFLFKHFVSQYIHIHSSFAITFYIFKTDVMQHLKFKKTCNVKMDVFRL